MPDTPHGTLDIPAGLLIVERGSSIARFTQDQALKCYDATAILDYVHA
jgi:hypothetical protein